MEPKGIKDPALLSPYWLSKEKRGKTSKTMSGRRTRSMSDFDRTFKSVDVAGQSNTQSMQRVRSVAAFPREAKSDESVSVSDILRPPDFLNNYEYFLLSSLICHQFKPEEIDELSTNQLLRFAEQGRQDIEYIDQIEAKILMFHEAIQLARKEDVTNKVKSNRKYYNLMRNDFQKCIEVFKQHTKTKKIVSVRESMDDDNSGFAVIVQRENMVTTLLNNWQLLVRYFDQLREVVPSPAQLFPDIPEPEFVDVFDKKLKLKVKEMFDKVMSFAKLMKANWDKLDGALLSKRLPVVFPVTKEDFVLLPIDVKRLPPTIDISGDIAAKENEEIVQAASEFAKAGWIVVEDSDMTVIQDEKKIFKTEAEANAYVEKLKKEWAVTPETPQVGTPHTAKYMQSVDPKPVVYSNYQPISRALLKMICKDGRDLSARVIRILGSQFPPADNQVKLDDDQKKDLKEFVKNLQDSLALWFTSVPSHQNICSDIQILPMQRSSGKREFGEWFSQFKKTVSKTFQARRRFKTEGDLPPEEYSRPSSPERFLSLPIGDSSGYLVPSLEVISASPSPSSTSPGSRSPERAASTSDLLGEDS